MNRSRMNKGLAMDDRFSDSAGFMTAIYEVDGPETESTRHGGADLL